MFVKSCETASSASIAEKAQNTHVWTQKLENVDVNNAGLESNLKEFFVLSQPCEAQRYNIKLKIYIFFPSC